LLNNDFDKNDLLEILFDNSVDDVEDAEESVADIAVLSF
jgi:hypothetical protein